MFLDEPPERGMVGKDDGELVRTDVLWLTGGFSSCSSPGLGDAGTVDRVAFLYGAGVAGFGVVDDSTFRRIGDRSRIPNLETSASSPIFWFLVGLGANGL